MSNNWRMHSEAATVDLVAAHTTHGGDREVLEHLQEAASNLEKAIEAIEEAMAEEEE